jgi:hypothetical protein
MHKAENNNAKYTTKEGGERLSPNLSVCRAIQYASRTSNNNPELANLASRGGADKLRPPFLQSKAEPGGNVREQGDAVEVELF